jgi:hypothetical protein
MKLYYAPFACSLAPHIVLEETGARFELSRVELSAVATAGSQDSFQFAAFESTHTQLFDDVVTVLWLEFGDRRLGSAGFGKEPDVDDHHPARDRLRLGGGCSRRHFVRERVAANLR